MDRRTFSISAVITGIGTLVEKLRKKARTSKEADQGVFTVGYKAPYAVYVHENLAAHHDHGQAKFLEAPARNQVGQLRSQIIADARLGIGIRIASKNAAITLLNLSKELVPVDTGILKASGYVQDDKGSIVAGNTMTPEDILLWHQVFKSEQTKNRKLIP